MVCDWNFLMIQFPLPPKKTSKQVDCKNGFADGKGMLVFVMWLFVRVSLTTKLSSAWHTHFE
jgi:hypothetical protein